jgi:hypothetical protein
LSTKDWSRNGHGLIGTGQHVTGGDTVTGDGGNYRVPKRYLVSTMQVLLQAERLKVAEELPDAAVLVQELLNFRVKIDTDGSGMLGHKKSLS